MAPGLTSGTPAPEACDQQDRLPSISASGQAISCSCHGEAAGLPTYWLCDLGQVTQLLCASVLICDFCEG